MEEIEVITVTPEPPSDVTKIGSDGFIDKLLQELHGDKLWRKLDSLAESLHVDPKELSIYLDSTPNYLRKSGKEDGVFYYCWEERYEKQVAKCAVKEKKKIQKPVICEEDRYAVASLHAAFILFRKAMKTFAIEINQTDAEAFNMLALALDKMESGLVLYTNKLGTDIAKLPTI